MPALAVAGAPARPWYRAKPAVAVNALVLSSFGLVAGTSAFFSGFYRPGEWVPIGLGLLAVATAGAIAHPPRLSRPLTLALVALGGLAAWALVSAAWAPSIEQATIDANRQFVLARGVCRSARAGAHGQPRDVARRRARGGRRRGGRRRPRAPVRQRPADAVPDGAGSPSRWATSTRWARSSSWASGCGSPPRPSAGRRSRGSA